MHIYISIAKLYNCEIFRILEPNLHTSLRRTLLGMMIIIKCGWCESSMTMMLITQQITKEHSIDRDSASESSIVHHSGYSNISVKLEWMFLVVKQEFRNLSCVVKAVLWVVVVFVDPASCYSTSTSSSRPISLWQRRIERGAIDDETTTIKRPNKEYKRLDEWLSVHYHEEYESVNSSRGKQVIYEGKKKNVFSERTL